MSVESSPLSNHLLVALPSLHDPHFARSVTLVCQHDADGAMGVMVNRASEYTLGEVLQQMGIASESESLQSQIVLAGGPVHPERGFVLHDGGQEWDSSLQVAEGLYLTTSRDVLEAMARGEGPRQAVVALGCAGWGSGQLEQELVDDEAPRDRILTAQLLLVLRVAVRQRRRRGLRAWRRTRDPGRGAGQRWPRRARRAWRRSGPQG